ncbi:mitogen-activated protein kinase kinase 3, putative [Leishmania donovani]|uniref:Mitogen-activated protein kinase kinase 3, putative n=1 Tax=Leishmania donovani TaxID=5661 RepID=A0A3S7WUE7_LEIDO|nr:mitogen-activated protein kinase kinase 3, putative [Leishmania donovani]AYU77762.1 mitogen-activated protein kinase kinase 3, putative [Leishmania donovani]TPP51624.1 Protein kinase domain family protein [Leishmania donovani]CBZ33160.1 mitogen-activated protein kinase kinase 3, putative [Leishmania donovani]
MDFYALQDTLLRNAKSGGSSDTVDVESRYVLMEKIGAGSYGDVWSATRRTGTKDIYAVKRIDKRQAGTKGLRSVMGEVETMSLLSHPNIVKLEETYQDEACLSIVMEYLPGGSLQHRIDRQNVSELETRRFITQLLMAVEYIHEKGIVHRDLKPSNCLLSQNDLVVKISDFGLSVFAGNKQCLTTCCGTLHFMAPEILLEKNYGKPVDMWAMGVMAHVMFLGRYPFQARTEAALTKDICRGYRPREEGGGGLRCPPLLQDFISQLLLYDPLRRMSAKDALKHPWIKEGLDANRRTSLYPSQAPSATAMKPSARWRAAALAVMGVQRLLYLQKIQRLVRLGYDGFPILRDYRYLVTGKYVPASTSVECSHMFHARPMALLELISMIDTCPFLKHVDLSWNNIHSLSVIQALLKVVTRHPSLQSIDLSHNPIPAVAGRSIVRLIRNPLSQVTCINVGDTGISADTIGQINSFLKEKLTPAALSYSVSTGDMQSRLTQGSGDDTLMTSSSTTMSSLQQKRSICSGPPKQPAKKESRGVRLPPISRPPVARRHGKMP